MKTLRRAHRMFKLQFYCLLYLKGHNKYRFRQQLKVFFRLLFAFKQFKGQFSYKSEDKYLDTLLSVINSDKRYERLLSKYKNFKVIK